MQPTTIFVATLLTALVSAKAVVPVEKRDRCPKPSSSCQLDTPEGCVYGYSACLEKFGCSGAAGGFDCAGTALGKLPLI